ncbi:uncharacterized protein N7483_013080 [Penicillium malachiteum]|uniref:uncharacterized protein n=1 Tax=Penicillium malachiteum TaxID=1324776 RepID=UPI00254942D6|nr:uncharacterized protein N7483_013080 [Penicillium malachiteum]KAJ5715899.1 hypothetical protein N7483_013080 [Penicillium malachiteum]
MYKFVPDSVGGVGSRRKLSHKTCDSCKKRHRRCLHNRGSPQATSQSDKPPSITAPNSGESSTFIEAVGDDQVTNSDDNYSASQRTPRISETRIPLNERLFDSSAARFVGNLSLEASFFATGNQTSENDGQRTNIGVWLVARPSTLEQQQDAIANVDEQHIPIFPSLSNRFHIQSIFPHIQTEGMPGLPPENEFNLMLNLYYSKFDPIFPIIHDENFETLEDVEASALKQCICLIVSLDPSMRSHLKLAHIEGAINQTEFRSHIAGILRSILHAGIIHNKLVLLQITALLAFFVNGPSSSEISSHYCAQAVEIAQTLGLHVSYPNESESLEKSHRLFWCIWALDRLNAATNGRPILIHEQDIGEQLLRFVPEHLPAFRLFLHICKLLDEVISQYRPRPSPSINIPRQIIPDFESLVCEAVATEVDTPLIASLEIFYLAIRILGCRPQPESDGPNRLPSSDAQSSAAASILSVASGDLKLSITYWVTLPYAISLATSVGYQTLRNSKLSHTRKRAYLQFQQGRCLLDGLSDIFVSARMMARLAQNTLKEASKSRGHTSRHPEENAQSIQDTQSSLFAETASHFPGYQSSPNPFDSATMPSNHLDGINGGNDENLGLFDDLTPSIINELFSGIDGSIDLSRVDTLFSANLNPTMPLIQSDWMDI